MYSFNRVREGLYERAQNERDMAVGFRDANLVEKDLVSRLPPPEQAQTYAKGSLRTRQQGPFEVSSLGAAPVVCMVPCASG